MYKKIVSILLALCFAFSFTCCGSAQSGSESEKTSESGINQIETTFEEIPTPPTYAEEKDGYEVVYFDSVGGDDANDGKSETSAKRSLDALNNYVASVREDDHVKILIKAGSSYEGTLLLTSFTASEDYPLIIDTYGVTETKKYAKFEGETNCVEISRGNIRVSGLECTTIYGLTGFYVYTSQAGAMKNIVISDNYVHDVNFDFESGLPVSLQGQNKLPGDADVNDDLIDRPAVCASDRYIHSTGGIYLMAETKAIVGPSWFENVWIENNTIERVARDGIWVNSNWAKRPGLDWGYNKYVSDDNGWYPHKNVNLLYNDVSYSGGCGMCMVAVVDGFIQGNTSYHPGYLMRAGCYAGGIWCHSCKNVVFQYNEAAYCHLYGGGDGEGFDIDIGNSDILFQYNYSHHNEGGGILLCNIWTEIAVLEENGKPKLDEDGIPVREWLYSYWGDNIVRNNIFADNGSTVFHIQGGIENLYIENNTMIIGGNASSEGIVRSNVWGDVTITGKNWQFLNNIFYLRNKRTITFDLEYCPEAKLINNVFCNFDDSLFEMMTDKESGYDFDVRNVMKYDVGFADTTTEKGIENISAFISKVDRVYEDGIALEKMAKYDMAGSNATSHYVGAFSAKR